MSTDEDPTSFRVRMKVWDNPENGKRYLVAMAQAHRVDDVMVAYAMNDSDVMVLKMNAKAWNDLPYFYFKIDGEAPKPVGRYGVSLDPPPKVGTEN